MYKQSHSTRKETVFVSSYEISGIACTALVPQASYSRRKGIKEEMRGMSLFLG